jgi:hypothetical protein
MPSPFLGLDPYLEAHWGDVHVTMMVYASDAMQERLPGDLYARVVEELQVDTVSQLSKDEPITRRHIEIRDHSTGDQVVTVLEIVTPVDKRNPESRAPYKWTQRDSVDGGFNLIEVDLVRSGEHVISPPENSIPRNHRTGLYASVRSAVKAPRAELYPISLDASLPAIAIPLRSTDQDIRLDLQALLTQAYDRGRYAATIDYTQDPDPALPPSPAEWADGLLRTAGRRQ